MSESKPNLDSLFEMAAAIESIEQRAAFLDRSCGDDHELRRQVQQLLESHEQAGSFLDKPPVELAATVVTETSGDELAVSLDAGRALTFDDHAAVVWGNVNHSVLKALGNTLDEVPQISLRDVEAVGADLINRSISRDITNLPADSRYRLDGEIARGGMGAIIRGRDTDLGRDLAIKVLLDEHTTKPEVIQRFIEEAQIGGQLQHPGIAPVYELGQFADQRPYFSMKLVKGQTLSALLARREGAAEDRGRFLGIFEQVCQTMAYAHSRGVIHRDLKPANIMVGAFGEVQVIDWGLAKVLPTGGVADEKKSCLKRQGQSMIQTLRSVVRNDTTGAFGSAGSETEMGCVMGTPAYMSPEQALGEIDSLNEASDVFGLGAILTEILTGYAPYICDDAAQVYRLASRGRLDDCYQRLDACEADAELVAVAKHCLELEPSDRPRDAAALAEQITGYLESVESKLRLTEMQRAAAAARAEEERKRRRVSLALAVSLILLLGLGAGGWIYTEKQEAARRNVAESRVNAALNQVRLHQQLADKVDSSTEEGLQARLAELKLAFQETQAAARLTAGDQVASPLVESVDRQKRKLEEQMAEVAQQAEQAASDRSFREELEQIRLSRAGGKIEELAHLTFPYAADTTEGRSNETHLSFDLGSCASLYEQAFRARGLDLTVLTKDEATVRIRQSAIRENLFDALDDWIRYLPALPKESGGTQPTKEDLLAIIDALDENPLRKKLRATLVAGEFGKVQQMAEEVDVRQYSPAFTVWLGAALRLARAHSASIRVLKRGQQLYPDDFWLNYSLYLSHNASGRSSEAMGYIRAALAIRPESDTARTELGWSLCTAKEYDDAIATVQIAIETNPVRAPLHFLLGYALSRQGRFDEAIDAWKKTIEIDPQHASAQYNICVALRVQRKYDDALEAAQAAINIDPDYAAAHAQMGVVLGIQLKQNEAIEAFRNALKINPKQSVARHGLGVEFYRQNNLTEALREWQQISTSDPINDAPNFALSHFLLGEAFAKQGQPHEAVAAWKRAFEMQPQNDEWLYRSAWKLVTFPDKDGQYPLSDQALKWALQACEISPEKTEYFNTLGIAYYRSQHWREALDAIHKSIDLGRAGSQRWLTLAICHWHLNNKEEAHSWYQKALEWRKNHQPDRIRESFFSEAARLMGSDTAEEDGATPAKPTESAPLSSSPNDESETMFE